MIKVRLPEWYVPPWWIVAYLIPPFLKEHFADVVRVPPDERFNEVVDSHTRAFVEKGVMPPEDIAPAILNIANDLMAGRQATIRTGDYIAIQNHIRRAK